MIIKGLKENYEVFLEMIQFEITGRCNMKCRHCRAWREPKGDITLETVEKVLDFALPEASNRIRFTISGGEPLLHNKFFKILETIKNKTENFSGVEIDHSVITTNGSLLTKNILTKIKEVNLGEVFIQVSIDDYDENGHDKFRNFPGAFSKAIRAVKMVSDSCLLPIIRTTITPDNLGNIEKMVKLANDFGVKRISFGPTIPTGKAVLDKSLILSPDQKKFFIETMLFLKSKYPSIDVSTEDPIKFSICPEKWNYGNYNYSNQDFRGGCSAGITNINILSDGTITPCSMLLVPVLNVQNKTSKEIRNAYTSSEIISNLVMRNIKGKCGICKYKMLCGGCRVAAKEMTDDYLSEDPTCWRTKDSDILKN